LTRGLGIISVVHAGCPALKKRIFMTWHISTLPNYLA